MEGTAAVRTAGPATLALLVLIALLLPGCSGAAGARGVSGRFRSWLYPDSAEVLLRGTHGYRITIFAAPLPAKKITVYLTKGDEKVTYTAPASVTEDSIVASLGPLGRIDGNFRPTATVRRVPVAPQCTGNRPPVIEARLASFVGEVAIHGESGFTEATGRADSAPPRPKAECAALRGSDRGSDPEAAALVAGGATGRGTALFAAAQSPILALWPSPPAPGAPHGSFAATLSGTSGPVTVERIVQVPAAPGEFSFDPGFASARVSPPAPFTGSAEFSREAGGSGVWSGDLGVDFAGLGEVPLTGVGFGAELGKESELVTITG